MGWFSVLAHRDDREALYAFIDRSETEADWTEFPPIMSEDELQNFPEFFEKLRRDRPKDNA